MKDSLNPFHFFTQKRPFIRMNNLFNNTELRGAEVSTFSTSVGILKFVLRTGVKLGFLFGIFRLIFFLVSDHLLSLHFFIYIGLLICLFTASIFSSGLKFNDLFGQNTSTFVQILIVAFFLNISSLFFFNIFCIFFDVLESFISHPCFYEMMAIWARWMQRKDEDVPSWSYEPEYNINLPLILFISGALAALGSALYVRFFAKRN